MSFRNLSRHLDNLEDQFGDLVETHEAASASDTDYSEYADRPVAFVRDVLGGEPWAAQEEIARAVAENDRTVVRSCNAAGKDWTAAQLALWFVYTRKGLVLITSATHRQVVEINMREVARSFHRAGDALPGEMFQSALRVGGQGAKSGILGLTSRNASQLTGFHAPRVMAVLTEAQGIEDFAWEAMDACTTGVEDRMLALGNPLTPSGKFFKVSHSENWHQIQISATAHPNVKEGREVIRGGVSRAFVQRMKEEYGEQSPVYKARVEGEFPEFSEQSLFRREWLDLASEKHERGEFEDGAGGPLRVAVDPAGPGEDKTAVAVRRGQRITRLETWHEPEAMADVGRVVEVLREEGLPTEAEYFAANPSTNDPAPSVVVDAEGLGHGLASRLEELGYRVAKFKAGERAHEDEDYSNKKGEAYYGLHLRLKERRVALPDDDDLFAELLATEYSTTSDGRFKVVAKDEIRSRLGRSPDRADALMMAFYPHTASRPWLSIRGRTVR